MTTFNKDNHLKGETSPYLLQHADNPVNWYPWGEQALHHARQEKKPILLSIGYSACHWCHVMAHESFENEKIAALMNALFVNIKVDREERPDLDKIYQMAQQMLTRKTGGWPLTMFLTPDEHIPFFGGTYFPPESRYGMPGFPDILQRVADFYEKEPGSVREQNTALINAFAQMQPDPVSDRNIDLSPAVLHQSIREMAQIFDEENGGFSSAPKFPSPGNLERLIHHYEMFEENQDGTLKMALHTLDKMAQGGIYDHVGGGFSRYAVDDLWMIPHFEKMLYDNGPLLALYSNAWKISGRDLYKKTALETADWMLKEMQSPEGGFYSSFDADSEGEEGRFYVWDRDEIRALLTDDEYSILEKLHGLDGDPNFEGRWHLYLHTSMEGLSSDHNGNARELMEHYKSGIQKLYRTRSKRVWPDRDEKMLTSWNALAITGLATTARVFKNQRYHQAAQQALEYIHNNHWTGGTLLATSKDGHAHLNAYLDDYAYLIHACMNMLQTEWSSDWLHFAIELAQQLLEGFYDRDSGGFYFTSHDHEKLLQRRMDFMDDAIPSGNAVAARSLFRLGHLIGDEDMIDASELTLKRSWPALKQIPIAHQAMLLALEDRCLPPIQVIIRGTPEAMIPWKEATYAQLPIRGQVYAIPMDEHSLPAQLAEKKSENTTTAYICRGFTCLPPITDLDDLLKHLKDSKPQ